MEQEVLNCILTDDLKKAKELLKNPPEDLKLVWSLLSKVDNREIPLKKLRANLPNIITINTSYVCNLRCEMCNSGFKDRTYLYEDYKYFLPKQLKMREIMRQEH